MKKLTAIICAAALVMAAFSFTGCGSSYDRTTFVLNKDGSAKQYIIDDAYNDTGIGELRDYIELSIEKYQGDSQEKRIKLNKCDIRNGKVDIELSYATCADYAAYNDVVCFEGTLQEAADAGFEVDREYRDAEGSAITYDQLMALEKEVRVLIMNEVTAVELPGPVAAVSTNVQADENGRFYAVPDTDESVPEEFRTINYENAYYVFTE